MSDDDRGLQNLDDGPCDRVGMAFLTDMPAAFDAGDAGDGRAQVATASLSESSLDVELLDSTDAFLQ